MLSHLCHVRFHSAVRFRRVPNEILRCLRSGQWHLSRGERWLFHVIQYSPSKTNCQKYELVLRKSDQYRFNLVSISGVQGPMASCCFPRYGSSKMTQQTANSTLYAMAYFSANEVTTPEREGKLGVMVKMDLIPRSTIEVLMNSFSSSSGLNGITECFCCTGHIWPSIILCSVKNSSLG